MITIIDRLCKTEMELEVQFYTKEGKMSNYPTFILIEKLNQVDAEMEQMRFPYRHTSLQYYDDMEQDLQSRQPKLFIKYDQFGNEIVSEVIGYVDGQEVWSWLC